MQTAEDYHSRHGNKGQAKAMKGVNKGPGKAVTNRAFADSDEDGGNHLALMMMMMMQATTTTPASSSTPEIKFP